jgi:hypothetical protein
LTKILPHFPVIVNLSGVIEKRIEKVAETEVTVSRGNRKRRLTEILRKLCFGQLMTFTDSPIAYVEKMAFLTQNTASLFKIVL